MSRVRYEGKVHRPPSEAHSLIVQVTIGCSHYMPLGGILPQDKSQLIGDIDHVLQGKCKYKQEEYRRL